MKKSFKKFVKNTRSFIFGRKLDVSTQKTLKRNIHYFFEGYDEYLDPIVNCPISMLEIHNFEFKRFKDRIELTITLQRPGLLIGKGGSTISGLEGYLTQNIDFPVKILIKESKLWN
jgi:ribosomal protein S3